MTAVDSNATGAAGAAGTIDRLVVTTGGTGGHIFPALAVAAEVRRRRPGAQVLFLGGSGPEGDLARKAGLEFLALPASGVLGKGVQSLLAVAWVSRGVILSTRALRRFQPQAVIGFGGYAGFCPVLAAALLGLPTAVHEQNSVPGVTAPWAGWSDGSSCPLTTARNSFPLPRCCTPATPCARRSQTWTARPAMAATCWCWAAARAPRP